MTPVQRTAVTQIKLTHQHKFIQMQFYPKDFINMDMDIHFVSFPAVGQWINMSIPIGDLYIITNYTN